MRPTYAKHFLLCYFCLIFGASIAQVASYDTYLNRLREKLREEWPNNKTINLVFHGHSVPSGYFTTPRVNTLAAYPYRVLGGVKEKYTSAVVNSITTSIGGEQSEQGEKRFQQEVLTHRPDLIFIDYALNDRSIGLERSEKAWRGMIEAALAYDCPVILLTPTPDLTESILTDGVPLEQHSIMIRRLAVEYQVGLVDSYAVFRKMAAADKDLNMFMSQSNHPNGKGHEVVAEEILKWF